MAREHEASLSGFSEQLDLTEYRREGGREGGK